MRDIVEGKVCMYILGSYVMFLVCKITIDPPSQVGVDRAVSILVH